MSSSSSSSLTITQITSIIKKIKNLIAKANNFLELENVIQQFQRIKQIQIVGIVGNKNQMKQKSQKNTKKQKELLMDLCQQLIKQKIKYFKKLAVKKIQKHNQHQNQEQQLKNFKNKHEKQEKQKKSSSSKANNSLTGSQQFENHFHKTSKSKKQGSQSSSLLNSKELKQLKELNQLSMKVNKQKSPLRADKRLKQSKSVDQFDKVKDSFASKDLKNLKNLESHNNNAAQFEADDDNKTQIKAFNKKNHFYTDQRENVEYYKDKLDFLENMLGPKNQNYSPNILNNSCNGNFLNDNSKIFDQYHFKIRQKSLELEELKGRIKYHETANQQMRNRVFNQQKRYEDYINSLKDHIKSQQSQIYKDEKEKKIMGEVIKEYQLKIEIQEKQKLRYIEQIQNLLKQKQRSKAIESNKNHDLKKQLEVMVQQQGHIRELEKLVKQQKIEVTILLEKNSKFEKQLAQVKYQFQQGNRQRQTLEELLELKIEEIETYKIEIFKLNRELTTMQQELSKVTQQLSQWQKNQAESQIKKEKMMRRKVQKLKQVKNLLVSQV